MFNRWPLIRIVSLLTLALALFAADVAMEALRVVTCAKVQYEPPPEVCRVHGSQVATFWTRLVRALSSADPDGLLGPGNAPPPAAHPPDAMREANRP